MQVYPDQTNVTIDMINKYVKGSFSKVCMQKDASHDAWKFAYLKLHFWKYNYWNHNIVDISGALFTLISGILQVNLKFEEGARDVNNVLVTVVIIAKVQ